MEFPNLGKHCSESSCNKLDFLPVKCDACEKLFCNEHMTYQNHNCLPGKSRDFQVPICPLCNKPVPSKRGEAPDIAVGNHIDRDCQSDNRKVFINKCYVKGCKRKGIVPVLCRDCNRNFCLPHRHPGDHSCNPSASRKNATARPSNKQNGNTDTEFSQIASTIQGNMTEDEALAHALALSLGENNEQPQQQNSRSRARTNPNSSGNNNNNNQCLIS